MSGEPTDDCASRLAANEKVIRDAIAAGFAKPVPSTSSKDLTQKMGDSSNSAWTNGQYRELRVDVDNLKTGFSDLRHDIDARFKEQQTESREQHREMLERLDRQNETQNSSKLSIEKIATIGFGAISLVLTLVWGYSTLTQASITDKITFTNDKIARDAKTTEDDVTRIEKAVGSLGDALVKRADKVDERFQKFVDDTVPRRELENRFMREDASATDLAKTVNQNLVPRTEFEKRVENIREDISTLKGDTLKRADIDGRFNDFTKRLDLISNRVEQLQQTSAGTGILQEQLREAQSQIKELRDHWLDTATTK